MKTKRKKKAVFEVGFFNTKDEAAFAYNVAALVFDGPDAELNKGMHLSLERKREIEKEVLQRIREYLELPSSQPWGRFPQLYME